MSSLQDEINEWTNSTNEIIDVILISFNIDLVNSILEVLDKNKNCNKIIIANQFLNDNRVNKKIGTSPFEMKYPGKIVATTDFGKNPSHCILFADFNGGTRLTPTQLDYFEKVDREPRYRRWCRSVMMYNFTGQPPINGYWMLEKIRGSLIYLRLSDWGDICQNFPIFTIEDDKSERINITSNVSVSRIWLDNLKAHIRYVVPKFMGTSKYIDYITSDDNMIIWVKCFIHETFNKIYGYNLLEFVGDKISSAKFTVYMAAKYKRLLQNEATEYHNQYMSHQHQWYLSEDLHLSSFILADFAAFTMTQKYQTDLFESFVGALYETVMNSSISMGESLSVAISMAELTLTNMFVLIGEQFPFEKRMIFGKSKHRSEQLLNSLRFPNGGEDFVVKLYEKDKGTETAVNTWYIEVSQKFLAFVEELKKEGKDISPMSQLTLVYKPQIRDRKNTELDFWDKIDRVFRDANLDITYSQLRNSVFITELALFDTKLHSDFVNKLKVQFPDQNVDVMIKRVQFDSTKNDNDNYVMMYIHTFEPEPNSKLLNSLTQYTEPTQKSGDDYLVEKDEFWQLKNLASVRLPLTKEVINGRTFDPYRLACYNCVKKYVLG